MSQPILTIVSQNNAVELVLTDASVTMRLAESLLEEVREEIRREPDLQQDGAIAKFARFITNSVDKLISKTIEYPLADIASVDYVNGTLVFAYNKKHMLSFEVVSVGNGNGKRSALSMFKEADARAFVTKFQEVKAAVS